MGHSAISIALRLLQRLQVEERSLCAAVRCNYNTTCLRAQELEKAPMLKKGTTLTSSTKRKAAESSGPLPARRRALDITSPPAAAAAGANSRATSSRIGAGPATGHSRPLLPMMSAMAQTLLASHAPPCTGEEQSQQGGAAQGEQEGSGGEVTFRPPGFVRAENARRRRLTKLSAAKHRLKRTMQGFRGAERRLQLSDKQQREGVGEMQAGAGEEEEDGELDWEDLVIQEMVLAKYPDRCIVEGMYNREGPLVPANSKREVLGSQRKDPKLCEAEVDSYICSPDEVRLLEILQSAAAPSPQAGG